MLENSAAILKENDKKNKLSAALRNNLQRRKMVRTVKNTADHKDIMLEDTAKNNSALYIGFMSGTSCDGVDASLINTDGEVAFEAIANLHIPYPAEFKFELKKLCSNLLAHHVTTYLEIEQKLTEFHIEAAHKLLKLTKYSSKDITSLGFHGQTIFHNSKKQMTWQIGNPHLLAQKTGINVIHDFRRRDISLRGQGAPLVPIFHKLLMRHQEMPVAVVNIGGVANITYIDREILIGFDTGPGNALIDDAMKKFFNKDYDEDGKIASTGNIDIAIAERVLVDEYFKLSYPKSLDRNAFEYIMNLLANLSPADIIATLTYITSLSIVKSIKLLPAVPKDIFLCGGGSKNFQMTQWLKETLSLGGYNARLKDISSVNNYNTDYIEAQAFAYMAARFNNNLPCAFPTTTGALRENICGCLVEY